MMSKTKRILALVLAVFMAFSLLSACGKAVEGVGTPSASSSPSGSADPVAEGPDISKEVTLQWMYHGSTVTDGDAVAAKINEYLKDKINAKLEMIWCGWGDFDDRVKLAINGGDPIDIYFTCSWSANEYSAYAKKGAYVRLDDPNNNLLEKYAPTLFDSIDPVLGEAAKTEGPKGVGIYAIPTYKEIAQGYTWDINADMLAKYGYSADDVKDFYEFGPMFEKIKAGEGKDFYPFNPEPAVLERFVNNNDYVDTGLLLSYEFDPVDPTKSGTKLVSRYETEGYKKFVTKMHEYYQAGYVSPEAANAQTMANNRQANEENATYAIGTQVYYPGYENMISRPCKVVYKPAQSAIVSTTSARGAMQAISTTSKNPDRALMLLNLVNSDAELLTMLNYGLEGVHYKKEADGRITFDPDKRATYSPWTAGLAKNMLLPIQSTEPLTKWEDFDKFNNSGKPVPILGWAFDADPVKNEIAALTNVAKEYADALNAGAVNPDEKLPEFIDKLKANGIDKVLAEAQKQLDAFLAAK